MYSVWEEFRIFTKKHQPFSSSQKPQNNILYYPQSAAWWTRIRRQARHQHQLWAERGGAGQAWGALQIRLLLQLDTDQLYWPTRHVISQVNVDSRYYLLNLSPQNGSNLSRFE